jgi:SAM-dependent methyltransferase
MIPEYVRVQWVSEEARDVWQPRFDLVSGEAHRMEVMSVKRGMRDVALVTASPEYIRKVARGLDSQVLGVAREPKVYSNEVQPYKPGEPFSLRTVVGSTKWVDCFVEAYNERDDRTIGRMLGYPECCITFFEQTWKKKVRDLTWHMANVPTNQKRVVVVPWTEINPMWQRLNLRAFRHIPCSFRCESTFHLVTEMKKLWTPEIWDLYMEIMSWPVEWSALHGAAEVRTPVMRMIHESDYTSEEYVVQVAGTNSPKEGARTDFFPWNLKHNIAYNNGFKSVETMRRAHQPILDASVAAQGVRTIYDPGCGNGFLLNSLALTLEVELRGCDFNQNAILEGRLLDHNVNIEYQNMFNVPHPSADLVVLMPGRLAEVPEQTARDYVARLNYRYLLLYGYQDNVDDLWYLKEKFFPQLRVKTSEVNELTTAILLERQ